MNDRQKQEYIRARRKSGEGRRPQLSSAQYTAGIPTLTPEDMRRLAGAIVPIDMALVILGAKAGRVLKKTMLIKKCRQGQIKPMGWYMNRLYFWLEEINGLEVQRRRGGREGAADGEEDEAPEPELAIV
jgi:hypothetical protein